MAENAIPQQSIYQAAGGHLAFQRLAVAHHARCLADPVLSHPFSHGGHPDHVARLGSYWAEVFGGPPIFSREYSGQSDMLALHANTGAEEDLGHRFVLCFVAAADDAGLPADAELRHALQAYMEWAVNDVMSYAARDAVVPCELPMPHWTWAGLANA